MRKSTYKFEGNFPLIRDLRKFPFDKAIWEIELSHPLNSAIFYPVYKHIQRYNIPTSVNAYQLNKINCPDKMKITIAYYFGKNDNSINNAEHSLAFMEI